MHVRIAAVLLIAFCQTAPLWAQRTLNYEPPGLPEAPSTGAMITKLFLLTGFVVVICLGLLYLSRRLTRPVKKGTKNGELEYVDCVNLNNRCALHLLMADNQPIVIGSDVTGIKSMVVLGQTFEEALATTDGK